MNTIILSLSKQHTKPHQEEPAATKETIMESCRSPTPEFVHDELAGGSAGLIENHNDDLLSQNPLPEQLLQCDDKDGDCGSNSFNDIKQNAEISQKAEEENVQEQIKVGPSF